MPGRGRVQRQCNSLNRDRAVVERSGVSLTDFWASAHGSFVVEGGFEETRAAAVASKLGREMARQSGATVLLTCSNTVEKALISSFKQTGVGYLEVCSPNHPRYDYFYGWGDAEIASYLVSVARENGLADQPLVQLISAFVSALSRCYRPSLGSMRTLASYEMSQVAQLAQDRGVESYHVSTLRSCQAPTAGALRFLLDWLAQALPSASLDAETGQNFSAVPLYVNETYLVNISSSHPSAVNAYFAHELERAFGSGALARVVLADVPLSSNSPLVSVLLGAQMRGCEVGVSLVNASRVFSLAESELGGLVFGSRVLFLDGNELSAGDLSVALQPLGTYQYHYPVLAAPGFAGLDVFGGRDEWSVATQERLRVRPEDTAGFSAVFYGADGRNVTLARSYRMGK